MVNGWFITGTDTGTGKTYVARALLAAAVAAGQRAIGMKPVACGCHTTPDGLRHEDAEVLMRTANVAAPYSDINPYTFAPAISPHLAAREAGVVIDLQEIRARFARLARLADYMVVEGAGGWLVPVSERLTMVDVARALELPVVLVVGMRLGCLNHALLTHAAIEQSGLALAGWIANCVDPAMERLDENLATLALRLNAAPLAVIPYTTGAMALSVTQRLANAFIKSD